MFGATGGPKPDPSKLSATPEMLAYVQQLKEQLREPGLLTPEIEGWNAEQYPRGIVAQGINWLVRLNSGSPTAANPPPWTQVPERSTQKSGETAANGQAQADLKKQIKELEQELAATKEQHAQEKDALEARISELRGGAARARLEERNAVKVRIEKLEQDLAAAKEQHTQGRANLDSRIEELEKQLAASTPKVMSPAWRLIRKKEPLAAFREAMTIFEVELRQALGDPMMPNGNRPLDLYPLLEMAAKEGHINAEQLSHLDRMRMRRNNVVHNSDKKHPLTENEARATLAYLEQIIA